MSFQDSKKKMTREKIRRSLILASNSSLSLDDVRREINKHIKQLKPQSLCTPSEKVCIPGPPGKKGSRGSRGRRGAPGDKGKKGAQGIVGPPGRHGKQGIMGDPGIKGEKGDEGINKESFFFTGIVKNKVIYFEKISVFVFLFNRGLFSLFKRE